MSKSSTEETALPNDNDISVTRLLGIGLATRLVVDTGVQIFFPFLPIIAQGMGLSTVVLGRLVSLRSLTGLFSPLFGTMADQRGYRFTMRLSLLLAGVGFCAIGLSPFDLVGGTGYAVGGAR